MRGLQYTYKLGLMPQTVERYSVGLSVLERPIINESLSHNVILNYGIRQG